MQFILDMRPVIHSIPDNDMIQKLVAIALLVCISSGQPGFAFQSTPLQEQIDAHLHNIESDLIDFRRDLHQYPEVSGNEKRTAAAVASHLKQLGLNVREGVGGHGVVALLKGGKPGPVAAFRADMDAVPSDQPDPVAFASKIPGVRHICGHDIHTTVGIALAEGLVAIQDDLPGAVLFIFQPSEENLRGARAMLDDGALENTRPDVIFSYHTAPLEVGQIGSKAGVLMASRDRFDIRLHGRSNIGDAARSLNEALKAMTTTSPGQISVIGDFAQVLVFESGKVKDENAWRIQGNVSIAGETMRAHIKNEIAEVLVTLEADGVTSTFEYAETNAAGVTNDVALEKAAQTPMRAILDNDGLVTLNSVPTGFSEDFGLFQKEVPGVMYFLGVSNSEKGWVGMPHSPNYVADEAAIVIGARAMAAVILNAMAASK